MWLQVMERYIAEIAEEIDRDREAGIAPPGPDSRVLGGDADVVHGEHSLYGGAQGGQVASQ